MFTSLAPSPMANVLASLYLCLINITISAFYLGDTLHANITLALAANSRKASLISSVAATLIKASPLTIIADS
jgi:hypothetical protein